MKIGKLWMGIPLIIMVLTVLFAVTLTSCDQPMEDDLLIGTWQKDEGSTVVEFTRDKKMKIGSTIYYYTTSSSTSGTKLSVKRQESDTALLGESTYTFPNDNKLSIAKRIDKLLQGDYNRVGGSTTVDPGEEDKTLEMPVANPNGGEKNVGESFSVTLTAETGAIIYYTLDGTTPTTSSSQYATAITISSTTAKTITIKAYATKTGYVESDVLSVDFIFKALELSTVATPTANPNGGNYSTTDSPTVTLTSATTGAIIYYTIDGNVPTVLAGTQYTGPIPITSTTPATITIKAIAAKDGMTTSGMFTSAGYVFTAPPVASVDTPTATPSSGNYYPGDTVTVTLATTTSGATIYYTTDGTTPTSSSTQYSQGAQISITSSTAATKTLKAIAIKDGASSNVLTATYVFGGSAKTVTTNADSGTGSLRALITTGAVDGDIIRVDTSITTIELNSEISIGKNITIEGNGVILKPSGTFPATGNSLLAVSSGKVVTIRRVHFKSGKDSDTGTAGKGSGIYNRGVLTVESCIFTINNAVQGGAIYNSENSTTAKGCTFYTNTATNSGGAIFINAGTLTLTGNLFYGNTAPANKGPTVYRQGGTVTSGGYNVSDTTLVEVSSGSWTPQATDKKFSDLGITDSPFVDPANDNYAPKVISALQIMPSTAISNFPTTDFNGRERVWPGNPGAVK